MSIWCRLFGHRWIEGRAYLICGRCLVNTKDGWPPMPRPIPPPPPAPGSTYTAIDMGEWTVPADTPPTSPLTYRKKERQP